MSNGRRCYDMQHGHAIYHNCKQCKHYQQYKNYHGGYCHAQHCGVYFLVRTCEDFEPI